MEAKESLNFNLREPRKKGVTPVYAVIKMNNTQYKISTGLKILPYYWNEKKQCINLSVIPTNECGEYLKAQKKMDAMRFAYYEYLTYFCNDESIEKIRDYIKSDTMANEQNLRAGNGRKPRATTLLKKAYDIYYREVEPTAKESSRNTTLTQLNGFYNYCEEIGKDALSMLTQAGLNAYQSYCLKKSEENQKNGKAGISNLQIKRRYNVVAMLINKVMAIHNDFIRYHIVEVKPSTLKVIEVKGEEKKKRPLMQEEIDAIKNAQGLTEEEQEYRDLFLIECNCSYRISDTKNMFDKSMYQMHTINGREYITFVTKKEDITTVIWLTDELKELLKKFDNGFKYANPFNNEKNEYTNRMNRLLQRICKKAGLNQMEKYKDQFGRWQEKPTYEIISSHWARYTFIYNGLFAWGMTSDQLKTFTAHADHKMIDEVYNVYAKSASKLVEQADRALQKVGLVDKKAVTEEDRQFAYTNLKAIEKALESNVDIFHLPITKKAIDTIKDISTLEQAKDIDKEKVMELNQIVYLVSHYFNDAQLYRIYQYKLKHFNISNEFYLHDSFKHSEDIDFSVDSYLESYEEIDISFQEYDRYLQELKNAISLDEHLSR